MKVYFRFKIKVHSWQPWSFPNFFGNWNEFRKKCGNNPEKSGIVKVLRSGQLNGKKGGNKGRGCLQMCCNIHKKETNIKREIMM